MEEPHEPPDVPQIAALLEYLRARASPFSGSVMTTPPAPGDCTPART